MYIYIYIYIDHLSVYKYVDMCVCVRRSMMAHSAPLSRALKASSCASAARC